MRINKTIFSAAIVASLAACSWLPTNSSIFGNTASKTVDITIFSFNDFHGNLQADKPIPLLVKDEHGHDHGKDAASIPSGGYAYLATLLKQRRVAKPNSIFVGAGDLIGASPIGSAILRDEPVIEALNQLDLSVTSLGNHEFDAGSDVLLQKLKGECPSTGCAYQGFRGARYDYIAANVVQKTDGKPLFKPYVIRQIADQKIAFIGAVTVETPSIVAGEGIKTLRFEDEAEAVNRYVPEIQKQGVSAIVLLIHEGANYSGAANDPSYQCPGLQGPIVDITKRLDKAIQMIVSGHSHQGYTCKVDGRLLVQARSYGGYITETTLSIDRATRQVVRAEAVNLLVEQSKLIPDSNAQKLVESVVKQTEQVRNRVVASVATQLTRQREKGGHEHSLGNVIADAELYAAKPFGGADIAFMNDGGVRADLPAGVAGKPVEISFGDIYAVQPFGGTLVKIKMTGAQILALLQQQWQGKAGTQPKALMVSEGFTYTWQASAPLEKRIQNLRLHGEPLQADRSYQVVTNSFLANGGDGFTVFKQATDSVTIGIDIDATINYLKEQGSKLDKVNIRRVQRVD